MSSACSKCGGEDTLYTDPTLGHVVCTACGYVKEEGAIVSDKDLEGTCFIGSNTLPRRGGLVPDFQRQRSLGYRWTPVKRYREGPREAATHFPRIIHSLGLPSGFSEEPLLILSKAISDREYWKTGRSADILAGACVYLACKKQRKPISICDVSSAIPCSVFALGRIYKKLIDQLKLQGAQVIFLQRKAIDSKDDLSNEINIEPYVNRICSRFLHSVTNESEKEKLRKMTIAVANLALSEFTLGAGRRLGSVIAASISLSAAVLSISQKKARGPKKRIQASNDSSDEEDAAWRKDFTELCSSLHVSRSTVTSRILELEDHFVRKARSLNLPWSNTITRSNLRHHVSFILQHFEFLAAARRVTPENKKKALLAAGGIATKPPSFVLQEKRREKRVKKIEAAKERIARLVKKEEKDDEDGQQVRMEDEEDEEEEVGNEDKVIEQLLLEGVDEKTIMDGYYESLLSDCAERKRRKLHPNGEFWKTEDGKGESSIDTDELGEDDIPDCDLGDFLRSPEEVEKLKALPFFLSPTPSTTTSFG